MSADKPPYDQRIAGVIVSVLAKTPLTPNAVTTFGLVVGLVAAVLFAQGDRLSSLIASLLFMLAVLNDHVDGGLARATGRTSTFGHYYDHVAASSAYIGMFIGAGVGLRHGWLGDSSVWLGIAAGLAVGAIFTVRMVVESRLGRAAVAQPRLGGFEIEDTLYIVGPITWLGLLAPFVLVAGIGAPVFLLWVLYEARRDLRRAPGTESKA